MPVRRRVPAAASPPMPAPTIAMVGFCWVILCAKQVYHSSFQTRYSMDERAVPMSTSGIVGEEIDKQAALASAALKSISGVGASARQQRRPRAVLDVLSPYSTALYIAQRVVQSAVFDVEIV